MPDSGPIQLSDADWRAIEREYCERRFIHFVRQAWPVLEPATEFKDSFHIEAICDHLEAVTYGLIRDIVINIPPRCMKSLLVSVLWPCWVWATQPHKRWLFSSYAQSLSIRDSVKCRRLILSPWYQRLWADRYSLTSDQNAKTRFDNSASGYRMAASVDSWTTGEGGDVIVVDDPLSAQGANSTAEREGVIEWWTETMSSRLNDPKTGARVIIMQRLHERDLTGYILEHADFEHLCLPMEYEPDRQCRTSIGWQDPRTETGELLSPARYDKAAVDAMRTALGDYGYAGQMQQRPAAREGGMFEWQHFQYAEAAPKLINVVRYWDKAGTEGGGAYSAGVKMGVDKAGNWWVVDVIRGQWKATNREAVIKSTADLDGPDVDIYVEQEPGSGGKESAEWTIRSLAGYSAYADRPTGDKEARARPYAAQVGAGNVTLLRGPWLQAFLDEHKSFPRSAYKDQVDAAAGAFAKLTARKKTAGVF